MDNKSKCIWFYSNENEALETINVIVANKENKTLYLLENISVLYIGEPSIDIRDGSLIKKDEIELPLILFNMLLNKLKGKEIEKVNTLGKKQMKEFINIITLKKDKYYQLIIDINNFTYEEDIFDEKGIIYSSMFLDDFIYDSFKQIIIDSGFTFLK